MTRRVSVVALRRAIEDAFWHGALRGPVTLGRFGEMLDQYEAAVRREMMHPERAPVPSWSTPNETEP